MSPPIKITSVAFRNFKAMRKYSVALRHMNILVGPNNCGKSTILGAFRALASGIRRARSKKAEWLPGPEGKDRYGYNISADSLPISIENVHTDYSEEDTTVIFRLSNDSRLVLFFPKNGGCRLFTEGNLRPPTTPTAFKSLFPITIGLVPILGPVEHEEEVLAPETVQRDLSTHRASRHFRNYWHHYPEHFDHFKNTIELTWPGMSIKPVERVREMSKLAMFCEENRILRELYWVGSGFQIWCQIITHVSRVSSDSIIIIDEPEIYLHPDVQRKLIGILRETGPDVLLATHSTEIIAEAESSDILLIDKSQQSAERLRATQSVQSAFDHLGSAQNLAYSQIARKRKVIYVEGEDFKLIRWIARRAGFTALSDGTDFVPLPTGGFGAWKTLGHRNDGMREALGKELLFGCIFDRDFRCDEEITAIRQELEPQFSVAHIHEMKELENYILAPNALQRSVEAELTGRQGSTTPMKTKPDVASILLKETEILRHEVLGQLLAKRRDHLKSCGTKLDEATIHVSTSTAFENAWSKLSSRLAILPGKKVLSVLNATLARDWSISISRRKIIDNLNREDIPQDFIKLLDSLEALRSQKIDD